MEMYQGLKRVGLMGIVVVVMGVILAMSPVYPTVDETVVTKYKYN